MDFNSIEQIKAAGFTGFRTMRELFADSSCIPKIRGVYMVLNPTRKKGFLSVGTGGYYKGKDPNVSLAELERNWVEDALVVYIGKAGSLTSMRTLAQRLREYFRFGQGKKVGHWGGRLIWQLRNSADLVVCWKTLPDEEPQDVETRLIEAFRRQFAKRPFANNPDR